MAVQRILKQNPKFKNTVAGGVLTGIVRHSQLEFNGVFLTAVEMPVELPNDLAYLPHATEPDNLQLVSSSGFEAHFLTSRQYEEGSNFSVVATEIVSFRGVPFDTEIKNGPELRISMPEFEENNQEIEDRLAKLEAAVQEEIKAENVVKEPKKAKRGRKKKK